MFVFIIVATGNGTGQPRDIKREIEEKYGIGITKTIVIAVCSAVAYLALVLGLTVWCSIRLMKRKKKIKLEKRGISSLHS